MTRSSICLYNAVRVLKTLVIAPAMLASLTTSASAGFLEDIFGGSDPMSQAAAPVRVKKHHYIASPKVDSQEREPERKRVKSEVQFMPVARLRERRERHFTTVAKLDDNSSVSAGSRPVVVALCAPRETVVGATASGLLIYDKTLRNGDILVTDTGVEVFRGQVACPHNAQNFVALSNANIPRSKRSMLLAIEDTMKWPGGHFLAASREKN